MASIDSMAMLGRYHHETAYNRHTLAPMGTLNDFNTANDYCLGYDRSSGSTASSDLVGINSTTPASTMTSGSGNTSPLKRPAAETPAQSSSSPPNDERAHKRQKNTEAARRYRQRKFDRVTELEEALASMTKERDDLRLKLARSETEADVLRGMVKRS
ncbi:hypothetical protein LTR37_001748 [Vermiconidia calcicola]|uniref:Uncharacterized protein n=1 Tax=Vermiconidia calcicola TaxID=1690605 RepID=A0ACC3NUM9_9PEZI|nr:hypothetical protein LTR37_001748 [Vermiconidia calcicola]